MGDTDPPRSSRSSAAPATRRSSLDRGWLPVNASSDMTPEDSPPWHAWWSWSGPAVRAHSWEECRRRHRRRRCLGPITHDTDGPWGSANGQRERSLAICWARGGRGPPISVERSRKSWWPGSCCRAVCTRLRALLRSPRRWASWALRNSSSGPPSAGRLTSRSRRPSASEPTSRSSSRRCHSARSAVRRLRLRSMGGQVRLGLAESSRATRSRASR